MELLTYFLDFWWQCCSLPLSPYGHFRYKGELWYGVYCVVCDDSIAGGWLSPAHFSQEWSNQSHGDITRCRRCYMYVRYNNYIR